MREILGNKKGIRDSVLKELETVYDMQVPAGQLLSSELALKLADITEFINREISLYVARNGQISNITIGGNDTVELPGAEGRRGSNRLSGLRCIHTHPNGNSSLSSIDFSALKLNKFDAMITIGVKAPDYSKSTVSFGMIVGIDQQEHLLCEEYGPFALSETEDLNFLNVVGTVERILEKQIASSSLAIEVEKTILVGVEWGRNSNVWTPEDSLEELKQLADTAGAMVINKFIQKRSKPDPAFFIGKGKVQELALYAQQEGVDLCVFDEELSPAQQRNIEHVLGIRVIDRAALILDIFAQRARTNEGKLQVELAQLQYNLPRIMGKGLSLSRLGGGIGTRGPGETKLEVDRRRIRDRIAFIKESIEKVKGVRTMHRANRIKNQVPSISLIGYTNAGKSTLLNTLTKSDIYAKDQLFATLDPTTRQLLLPDKQEAILTDTVGFIQRLPHQLVAAFRSTLEETMEADLLLHVIDVSHQLYKEQSDAVYKVLEQIGADDKRIITVFNKIDKAENSIEFEKELLAENKDSICISARTGYGLDGLLKLIVDNLQIQSKEVSLLIPFSDSNQVAKVHDLGTVLNQTYVEEGTKITVRLTSEYQELFAKYMIQGENSDN